MLPKGPQQLHIRRYTNVRTFRFSSLAINSVTMTPSLMNADAAFQVSEFKYSSSPQRHNSSSSERINNGIESTMEAKRRSSPAPAYQNARQINNSKHSTTSSSAPAKTMRKQKDNLLDLDRLDSARKRLQENYQEAQNAAAWEALMGLRMEAGQIQDVSSSMSPNDSVDLSIKDEDNNWSGQDHLQFWVNATKGFVTLLNGETSVSSRDFKSKMQTEHIELLQSPWLIELGAFHLNCDGSDIDEPVGFFKNGFLKNFSCDLTGTQQLMTMTISETMKYEYSLACPICLDTLFNPDALSCGHLFCKGCACGAASVYIFQGIRPAPPEANCPTCRTAGVFAHAVHMTEIDLLIKTRSKDY